MMTNEFTQLLGQEVTFVKTVTELSNGYTKFGLIRLNSYLKLIKNCYVTIKVMETYGICKECQEAHWGAGSCIHLTWPTHKLLYKDNDNMGVINA